jgi:hypothetical protein
MTDERSVDLAAFATRDAHDDTERMLTQIVNGVPKRDADTVVDAQKSALWDRISAGVRAISARGGIVVYGPGADD